MPSCVTRRAACYSRGMDPLQHPSVTRARRTLDAARAAVKEADIAYISAVIRVCGSRDAAAPLLDLSPRQLARRLSSAGIRARDLTADE